MAAGDSFDSSAMHEVDDCLIVSVNAEPDDRELRLLRGRVLARVEKTASHGVVLDVSKVRVMDTVLFGILAETARMITLLGRKSVFVGFQAGIASTLVDLDVEMDDLETALTMEDGLDFLRRLLPREGKPEKEAPEEPTGDEDLADDQLG